MNEETWFTWGLQKRMYNSLIRSQASCRHHAISKRDGDGYQIYAEITMLHLIYTFLSLALSCSQFGSTRMVPSGKTMVGTL